MEGFLNQSQRTELKEAHRTISNGKLRDRIKAILMFDEGWSASQIAHVLLIDETTARRYLNIYEEEGIEGLTEFKYSGGQSKLTVSQEARLIEHLEENLYHKVEDIARYVESRFGEIYTVSGMTKLLKRLGFVYKKTKQVPGKANPEAQEAFVREYEELKKSLKKGDKIYFADGTHPRHNSVTGYGWIKKGSVMEIEANTGRHHLNINGAICADDMDIQFVQGKSVNAQSTIRLLKKLEKANPGTGTIYLIVDNARYYRSALVKEFLKTSRVVPKFLPPYSPNLNLIERLWKLLKKEVLTNVYYEKFSQFKYACTSFLKKMSGRKDLLGSLITENFQILGFR